MQYKRVSYSLANGERVVELPEIDGFVARIDPDSRGTQHHRDMRRGLDGKIGSKMMISSPNHSSMLLAEKFAQDALGSKEMQDTIKELSSLKGHRKQNQEISKETEKVFQSTATPHKMEHVKKTTVKTKDHSGHRGHGKRKHNKHQRRNRKHPHPKRRLKKQYSKKESSKTARRRKTRKSINGDRRRGLKGKCSSEELVTCRRKRSDQIEIARNKKAGTLEKGQNYIEELPILESTHRKYRKTPFSRHDENKKDVQSLHRKRSHMIAQLMLTTTSDPNKKKPGDQGVEYSEYYSDNDNILSPEIRAQSELDEVVKDAVGGQIRSIRETGDENLLDQDYYDSSNEQQLREDVERLKRNDKKSVRGMEDPSNFMEYVDNTYRPALANEIAVNQKIPQYLNQYNYFPDQNVQRGGDPYPVLSNPPVEALGLRKSVQNRFPADAQTIFNKNPPIIKSYSNVLPSNMIPLMARENPTMNHVQSVTPEQSRLFGNVVVSPFTQPDLAKGGLLYSSNGVRSPQMMLTSPVAYSTSTSSENRVPQSENLFQITLRANSSLSGLKPTPSYASGGNNRILGSEAPSTRPFIVPVTPKAPSATYGITSSPSEISTAYLDSLEIFPRLRDIGPEAGGPAARYFNYNDDVENIEGPAQIDSIPSRKTAQQGSAVKPESTKACNSTKTEEPATTTSSELDATKKHGVSKTAKGTTHSLVSTMSTQASQTLRTTSTLTSQSLGTMSTQASQTLRTTSTLTSQSLGTMSTQASQTLRTTSTPTSQSLGTMSTQASQTLGTISTPTSQSLGTMSTQASQTLGTIPTQASQALRTTSTPTSQSLGTILTQASQTLGSSVSPPANRTPTINETKAVASEILSEIVDELEQLRLENPQNEQREGLPCRLTGSWVTARAGVRIDMTVTNHSVNVSLDHLTPPISTEGLLNVTWNVTGFAPFKRGGPFTLLATNNHTKTLAVFVGACKVCQGIDTIEGLWTVSREPRDCRDFQMSTSIFNEIFRRTRLYSAIKDKQFKQEVQVSTTMSGNNSTLESTSIIHDVLDSLGISHNHTSESNSVE